MAKSKPEIERRWLLWRLPEPEIILNLPTTQLLYYHTLYLCYDDPEFRLRKVDEPGCDTRYKMAVKEGEEGEERDETLIEPTNGARLFQRNLAKKLPEAIKNRYRVALPGDSIRIVGEPSWPLVWELDQFFGKLRGIFMAEIELPKKGLDIKIPHWLVPHIVAEVTARKEFYNKNMAAYPQKALALAHELRAAHGKLGSE